MQQSCCDCQEQLADFQNHAALYCWLPLPHNVQLWENPHVGYRDWSACLAAGTVFLRKQQTQTMTNQNQHKPTKQKKMKPQTHIMQLLFRSYAQQSAFSSFLSLHRQFVVILLINGDTDTDMSKMSYRELTERISLLSVSTLASLE